VAAHLPTSIRIGVVDAANQAYGLGMAEVMLVSAVLVLATAIAIAIFLPTRITPMEVGDV
jgi:hypothetical protein